MIRLPRFRGKPVAVVAIAWSPRADRFAYSDLVGRVYVVSASTGGLRRVAIPAGPGRRYDFAEVGGWSPDGKTLAIAANIRGCRTGEPRLLLVGGDRGGVKTLSTNPPGSAANEYPAYITPIAWSPHGSHLAYGWQEWEDVERCQENRPGVSSSMMTIGANGEARRQLLADSLIFTLAWSPSGRAIVAANGCDADDPLAWTPDELRVITATSTDCSITIVQRSGQTTHAAALPPKGLYGLVGTTVLWAVGQATGETQKLRVFANGVRLAAIGTVPEGGGIVAHVYSGRSRRLAIIPLDGSPLKSLPALNPPKGMTVGGPEAIVFTP
jgi:hypothetical protein